MEAGMLLDSAWEQEYYLDHAHKQVKKTNMKTTIFIAILFTAAIITSALGELKGQYYDTRGDTGIYHIMPTETNVPRWDHPTKDDSCKKIEMLTIIIDQTKILQIDDQIFESLSKEDFKDVNIRMQQRIQLEEKLMDDFKILYPPGIK